MWGGVVCVFSFGAGAWFCFWMYPGAARWFARRKTGFVSPPPAGRPAADQPNQALFRQPIVVMGQPIVAVEIILIRQPISETTVFEGTATAAAFEGTATHELLGGPSMGVVEAFGPDAVNFC